MQQQIAEISGIQNLQPVLIDFIQLPDAPVGDIPGLGHTDLVRREAAVLETLDRGMDGAGRPALVVDLLGLDDLLHQPDLVVLIQDREIRLQTDQFCVPAQHPRGNRVERADPEPFRGTTDHRRHTVAHFTRRLVGERHG